MRTLAFMNQKGGSCKTSSAVNLAAALGERGRKVLLVDLDPQASASAWVGAKDESRGLLEVFTGGRKLLELVQASAVPGVDVVPSSAWLVGVEKAVAGEPGAEAILRRALERLPRSWDYVFLDCPPALGLLVVSALVAADEVFVPVEASAMALGGLAALMGTVETVRARLNPSLKLAGILVCRVDSRTRLSAEVVERLRERFGKTVYRSMVRETVRLREAWSFSKPVTVYAPSSHGAEDYRAVAAEFLRRT